MKRRNMLRSLLAIMLISTSSLFAAESAAVKGNPTSKVYHLPSCRHFSAKGTTAEFKTEAEAVKAGYKPCKQCVKKTETTAPKTAKKK